MRITGTFEEEDAYGFVRHFTMIDHRKVKLSDLALLGLSSLEVNKETTLFGWHSEGSYEWIYHYNEHQRNDALNELIAAEYIEVYSYLSGYKQVYTNVDINTSLFSTAVKRLK